MSPRIVILVHRNTRRDDRLLYFVSQLAACWMRQGMQVIAMNDPRRPVQGDLLFVHVDLSLVPDAYLEVASSYRSSVNARVRDIRKSTISRHLVGPDSDWDGPVIAKTVLNCAGLGEKRFARRRIPEGILKMQSSDDYPVYAHLRDVPDAVFADSGLVVEKFLPERSGGDYCLRSYNFLGDVEDCFLAYSESPVVNLAAIKRMETVEVHPDIRRMREKMGFDYGKFDYVVHDGRAVLLDANKTPGNLPLSDEAQVAMVKRRAEGIRAFLG